MARKTHSQRHNLGIAILVLPLPPEIGQIASECLIGEVARLDRAGGAVVVRHLAGCAASRVACSDRPCDALRMAQPGRRADSIDIISYIYVEVPIKYTALPYDELYHRLMTI